MRTLFSLFVVLMSTSFAHADVQKWIDKNGRVNYGDVVPAGAVKASKGPAIKLIKKVEPAPVVLAPQAPAEKRFELDPMEREAKDRAIKEGNQLEKDRFNKETADADTERCKIAQHDLQAYSQGGRISKMNEAGEREFISSEEIDSKKLESDANVRKYCK